MIKSIYRPNNDATYNQAFNNINCNKINEIWEEKAQTQEFVIEVQLIAYIPVSVAT